MCVCVCVYARMIQANKEMAQVQAMLDQKKVEYNEHMARCNQREEVFPYSHTMYACTHIQCMHALTYNVCMPGVSTLTYHACMHTSIRTCMHACMHAYVHACMHAYVHACMHACMHAPLQPTRGGLSIHTYNVCMHACMHTEACTHVQYTAHIYI